MQNCGDVLQMSTLPEALVRMGYEVRLSSRYMAKDPEVRSVIWETNPYVSSWTDEPATHGLCRIEQLRPLLRSRPANPIPLIEEANGVPGPHSQYPRVYIEPRHLRALADIVLIDFGSNSQVFPPEELDDYFLHQIRDRYAGATFAMALHRPGVSVRKHDVVTEYLQIPNLLTFLDAIASCRAFVTLESGALGLASAIRANRPYPEVHAVVSDRTFNGRAFSYPNVELSSTPMVGAPRYWPTGWP